MRLSDGRAEPIVVGKRGIAPQIVPPSRIVGCVDNRVTVEVTVG